MPHKYKLRAETFSDLVKLADAVAPNGRFPLSFTSLSIYVTYDADGLPDSELEATSPLALHELLAIIGEIPDGHVMYETVQPIERYTGQRDREREPAEYAICFGCRIRRARRGDGSYEEAGRQLAVEIGAHVRRPSANGVIQEPVAEDLRDLRDLTRRVNDETWQREMWAWLHRCLPKRTALVPTSRRKTFLDGFSRAIEDGLL